MEKKKRLMRFGHLVQVVNLQVLMVAASSNIMNVNLFLVSNRRCRLHDLLQNGTSGTAFGWR